MHIETRDTDSLRRYEANPRKNARAVAAVARSIESFGFRQPIVVDADGVVVVGHTRLLAAQQLGLAEVPVHVASDLTPEQARAYRIADNRTNELAEWDDAALAAELGAMADVDWKALGFTGNELDRLLPRVGECDADECPDPPSAPISKPGDLWVCGEHRILCGDSTKAENVGRVLGGAKPFIMVTDPPYGMNLDTDWSGCIGSIGRSRSTSGNKYDRVIGDDSPFDPSALFSCGAKEMFLFGADYYAERIPDRTSGSWLVWDKRKDSQADAIGSEFELIWSMVKHKRRVLRHDWLGFLSSGNASDAHNRTHPTQKPVTLIADILSQWSGDGFVYDPFLGSGTTVIAAEQLCRRCFGIEIEPKYVDVAVQRWEKFTGKKAERDA